MKKSFTVIRIYLWLVIAMVVTLFLCSCASKKSVETTSDYQGYRELTERMDSMMRSTSVWQQEIYQKQTSLVDSFRQSEVRDTSHTIFLGAKGDTIKETIVIKEYVEREHQSSEKTQEQWEERFHRTDSILQATLSRIEKSDSTAHDHQKATVVEKASFGTKIKWLFGGVIIALIGVFCCATAFMRKR